MDSDLNKFKGIARYLAFSYGEIQHKTSMPLHGSMFFSVAKIKEGYQIKAVPTHFNTAEVKEKGVKKAHEDATVKIVVSESELMALVDKKEAFEKKNNKKIEKFKQHYNNEKSNLQEIFQQRLVFLTQFQRGYIHSEEENKQKFIKLMTRYPIAAEISKGLNQVSFYEGCHVTFKSNENTYQIKAIDYHHGEQVIADFEISKKQLSSLAKLEEMGIAHDNWVIEDNLRVAAMQDGSLYLKFESSVQASQAILKINAVYGEGACRISGAGLQYLKIDCKTESGQKAIEEILVALNRESVPKYRSGLSFSSNS